MPVFRYLIPMLLITATSCRSQSRSSASLNEAIPDRLAVPSECSGYKAALTKIATLAGMSEDSDLEQSLMKYCNLNPPATPDPKFGRQLLDALMAQKWGGQITDYVITAELLFEDNDPKFKEQNVDTFHDAIAVLNRLRQDINLLVGKFNDSYTLLDAADLRRGFQGTGLVAAVFDVFDDDLLAKQRVYYKGSHIEQLVKFGDPVALNHGNIVIDILLALAPELTIVPVSANTKSYKDGIRFIAGRQDVAILNMSRAFLGTASDTSIDPDFAHLISQMSEQKIIIKALGNTGADLDGTLNPRRQSAGLGPVGDLTAYDSRLIKGYLQLVSSKQLSAPYLLLAENLTVFGDQISLTATIPGTNIEAQERTVNAPADGVFSWSTDNFESGSSFAAPQIAGLAALLVEACSKKRQLPWQQCLEPIVGAIKASAKRPIKEGSAVPNGAAEFGLGLVSGDKALQSI